MATSGGPPQDTQKQAIITLRMFSMHNANVVLVLVLVCTSFESFTVL